MQARVERNDLPTAQIYKIIFNNIPYYRDLHSQNILSYGENELDYYKIESVIQENDTYYMQLRKVFQDREDDTKKIKLTGDTAILQAFKIAVDTYNRQLANAFSNQAESKGNLRF